MKTHSELVGSIWLIADFLQGDYKQADYGRVILPFTLLRRLDCVLEPSKAKVLATARELSTGTTEEAEPILNGITGLTFHNASELNFQRLLDEPTRLTENLVAYVNGFSQHARDVLERLGIGVHAQRLADAGLLHPVLVRFGAVDFHADVVPDHVMGTVFEELVRKSSELSNETSGEHVTPHDVARLMVRLLFTEDETALHEAGCVRTLYDPACGIGGMFSVAETHFEALGSHAELKVYGQDLNQESYAICKADVLIKGQNADAIKVGDSFSEDLLPDLKTDYVISQPPFGLAWTRAEESIRAEHESLGDAGRFGPGLPRRSDASLLFLLHMLSKMKPASDGGSRLAFVSSGAPLFTGGAASGESEIRRYIIERDLLEAIVALPSQLFSNTGIATYVWLITNRKSPARKGKVQLIHGVEYFRTLRKPLGDKRKEMSSDNVDELGRLHAEFSAGRDVKVLNNEDFGFHRLTIERPLRLNYKASAERIARLNNERVWKDLLANQGEGTELEPGSGTVLQEAVLASLGSLDGKRRYRSQQEFVADLEAAATRRSVEISGRLREAILNALSERDQTAEICMGRSGPEPDSHLRSSEELPLSVDPIAHFESRIRSEFADAWLSNRQVLYAIRRLGHLGFGLERQLEGLREQYGECEVVPLRQVCTRIARRPRSSQGSPVGSASDEPLRALRELRQLVLIVNPEIMLAEYLAIFFSTELGRGLLAELSSGLGLKVIDPEDLAELQVPVPTLPEQENLLEAKSQLSELGKLLHRVETELAGNPANIADVNATLVPMLRVVGKLTTGDEIRELIRSGESKTVEFKQTFSLDVKKQTKETYIEKAALKTIVAFLNSDGGDLLIGVDDDGQVHGVGSEVTKFHGGKPDRFLLHVKNRLKTRIGEQSYPQIDQRTVQMDGQLVFWIHCERSNEPIFLDDEAFFVRTNPATDELKGRKQHKYIENRFGGDARSS